VPNFARLDPGRPDVAILLEAMLRAREVIATRSWSMPYQPTSEHWWADVLEDPRARRRRVSRGLGGRTVERAYYTLADEPHGVILVACTKCPWQAAFSRADLIANYGEQYPLPDLLDHLAKTGCSKMRNQWDRCGVYYVNPIERLER
jgi:hypothetical protein